MISKINYVSFLEKIDARGICCLIKRALGDEFATLWISIELLFFFFLCGKVNKGKIYSVLNLNVHPHQIFITFFALRPLRNRKIFDSLLSKAFWRKKKTPLNNEKQWMKKNSIWSLLCLFMTKKTHKAASYVMYPFSIKCTWNLQKNAQRAFLCRSWI